MQKNTLKTFDLRAGRVLARKYEVISLLGSGWEGEVYKIRELDTGIERAAKLFFPVRNQNNKTINLNAKKLHKLKDCSMVIHYHTREVIQFQKRPVVVLISEFVAGDLLLDYLHKQKGKRLSVYKAAHFLHALCVGLEEIHECGDFHGDLHEANIIIARLGITYQMKVLDLMHNSSSLRNNQKEDIVDLVKLFYFVLGGQKYYAQQPELVKSICRGLKRGLILSRFKTVSQLKLYLEAQDWG